MVGGFVGSAAAVPTRRAKPRMTGKLTKSNISYQSVKKLFFLLSLPISEARSVEILAHEDYNDHFHCFLENHQFLDCRNFATEKSTRKMFNFFSKILGIIFVSCIEHNRIASDIYQCVAGKDLYARRERVGHERFLHCGR